MKKLLILQILAIICMPFASALLQARDNTDSKTLLFLDKQYAITSFKKRDVLEHVTAPTTIITAQDIEASGAQDIHELLDRITNIYSLGSHLHPKGLIAIRGDVLSAENNHVLFLLNGRPITDSTYGGIYTPVLVSFPLNTIEYIEVTRGAGSLLYGTNACSGVINIITKKKKYPIGGSLTFGSFNSQKFDFSGGWSLYDINIYSGLSFFTEDGWKPKMTDENSITDSAKLSEQNMGANIALNYKRLNIDTFYSDILSKHLGHAAAWPVNNAAYQSYIVNIGYEHPVSAIFYLNVNVTYNKMKRAYPYNTSTSAKHYSNDNVIEVVGNYTPSNKTNLLFGVSSGKLKGELSDNGIISIPVYSESYTGAFSQFTFATDESMKITLGARWHKGGNDKEAALSPKGALGIKFSKQLGFNYIFEGGFRRPSASEKYIDSTALTGNSELLSETANTTQSVFYYNGTKLRLTGSYFKSEYSNVITPAPTGTSGVLTYDNSGSLTLNGVEVETKFKASSRLDFDFSYSIQSNQNSDGTADITHMPNSMIKTGITYKAPSGFSANLFDSQIGKSAAVSSANAVNPDAKAYNYLSLCLTFDIMKLFTLTGPTPLICSLYGSNLLNADVYYPEFSRQNINTIPGRPGISIYGKVSTEF